MKELIKKATNNACLTAIACALAATLTAEPALADGTAIKGDLSTDTKFLHTTVSATSYALIVFNSNIYLLLPSFTVLFCHSDGHPICQPTPFFCH